MSKIEEVRTAMYAAMKAKDKERKDALSMLLGALKAKAIDKREDLTEAEENSIIAKEIKQCKDTIEMSPADRTDIIDQCKLRIDVYEEFAPKQMSEDEIKASGRSRFRRTSSTRSLTASTSTTAAAPPTWTS